MIIFNYILSALVPILIFLSACSYSMGQDFGVTQLNVFRIGVPIIWIVSLCLKPVRSVKNLWINALMGLAFVSILFLSKEHKLVSIEPLMYVFMGIALYYTLSNYLKDITPILWGIMAVIGFQAIIVLLQVAGIDPICVNDGGLHNTHMVGLFGAKYVLGAWMALSTPILLFNRRYFFGILSAILCICSFSWASVGLMILTLMIGLCLTKKQYIVWCVVTLIAIGSLLYTYQFKDPYYMGEYCNTPGIYVEDYPGHHATRPTLKPTSLQYKIKSRIEVESRLLPALFSSPYIGYGLGSFKHIGPQIVNSHTMKYGDMSDAWNDYLERGIEMGLGFIALFLILCLDTIKRFKRFICDRQMIGIFCSLLIIPFGMLFHDYMNHASINTLIICLFACFAMRGGYDCMVAKE